MSGSMTSRERLSTVLRGGIPDCVPVAPDTSNMIPARLTGKPFWDIYIWQDPPLWKAYIDCVKRFGFDSLMDGYAVIRFDDLDGPEDEWEEVILRRDAERIVTRSFRGSGRSREWSDRVTVYFKDQPPARGLLPQTIGLPAVPDRFEPIEGRREWPKGEALLELVKRELGEHGLVGVVCGTAKLLHTEKDIYDYADDPSPFLRKRDELLDYYERRFRRLVSLRTRPDFIATGGSGALVHQTPAIFRDLALPIVRRVTELCAREGLPSHIHSCGPERELVRICAEETDLTVIDPLEIPPMGDCDLAELKRLYGRRLVLKGNLHTTRVMLHGSPEDVARASRHAIDDAAEGGRFILSTGDQCGRDTPDENLHAMIETARSYGRY